jgi:excisionase family DNA binding protein
MTDELLTVEQAAKRLGTFETGGVSFPRRLISERRIRFVKLGHLVRIPSSAIQEYIERGPRSRSMVRSGSCDGWSASVRTNSATALRSLASALSESGFVNSFGAAHVRPQDRCVAVIVAGRVDDARRPMDRTVRGY